MGSKNSNILLELEDVLNTYKSKYHGEKALIRYKPWFPLRKSITLSGIVGDLMGDGHLQDYPKLRLDYSSKSVRELERFNRALYSIFELKGKTRRCTTNRYITYNLGVNNKPLARILKLIGVPAGSKVLSNFKIPEWILEEKKFFKRFINRLFSCEACVDLTSKCIEIKMYKSEDLIDGGISFFNDISIYLYKYFSIKTTRPFLEGRISVRKDGIKTRGIRLKIKNRDSLKKFKQFIGFEDKNKKMRLEKITL